MSSNPTDFVVYQGDTFRKTITYSTDGSPSVVDLTSVTISGDVKVDRTSDPIVSFTIDPTDLANGTFDIVLSSTQTASLPIRGARFNFLYDLQLDFGGSPPDIKTILFGNLRAIAQVTE